MDFKLGFAIDGATFSGFPEGEIADTLRRVADEVADDCTPSGGVVRDANGNRIGAWQIEGSASEPASIQADATGGRDEHA